MNEKKRPSAPLFATCVLAAVFLFIYLPVIVMVFDSLVFEGVFSIEWYRQVFASRELLSALQRSFIVGLLASLVATALGTLASIAITKNQGRLTRTLSSFSLFSLVIPELVFALALLSWFYILKIPLSLFTVVVAHVTFSISFVIMTVNGRATGLDPAIEDAGRDLGASEWLVLKKITLPLLGPAIVAGFLIGFLLSFDDFLISFYISGVGSDTLPIRLYAAMRAGLTPKLSALATIMLLISALVILLIAQISIVKPRLNKKV